MATMANMTAINLTGAYKFSAADVAGLREELLHLRFDSRADSWQAGDVITNYLTLRGYGVEPEAARSTASRIKSAGYSTASIEEELGKLALVM